MLDETDASPQPLAALGHDSGRRAVPAATPRARNDARGVADASAWFDDVPTAARDRSRDRGGRTRGARPCTGPGLWLTSTANSAAAARIIRAIADAAQRQGADFQFCLSRLDLPQ